MITKHSNAVLSEYALLLLNEWDKKYQIMHKDDYVDLCLQINQYLRDLVNEKKEIPRYQPPNSLIQNMKDLILEPPEEGVSESDDFISKCRAVLHTAGYVITKKESKNENN